MFDFDDLYVNGSDFIIPNIHDERYIAKYTWQAWHTDLHYLEKYDDELFYQFYLITFIDKRTRKVFHYEVLPNKTMKSTSSALKNLFLKYNQPSICDSIKKFTGKDFQDTMNQYGWSHIQLP